MNLVEIMKRYRLTTILAVLAISICSAETTQNTVLAKKINVNACAPHHFAGFSAVLDGNVVDFTWTCSGTESNIGHYLVERSKDGHVFEPIVERGSIGNGSRYFDYYDIDDAPLRGISFYRLKQFNTDGSVKYSEVITINYQPRST
jgi:hypothetical protein